MIASSARDHALELNLERAIGPVSSVRLPAVLGPSFIVVLYFAGAELTKRFIVRGRCKRRKFEDPNSSTDSVALICHLNPPGLHVVRGCPRRSADNRHDNDARQGTIAAHIRFAWWGSYYVDYSNELWWQVEAQSEVPRFLRASVGAAVVLLLFGFARLFRLAPHQTGEPGPDDLNSAGQVISNQTSTSCNLVYLRDKALLFNKDRNAFLMYGVQGRTWAALGDPVGPPDQIPELIRTFLERCDDFGGVPVFYEVTTEHLHRYADFGLTFVKLGEEARVDLNTFTLEGSHGARYRQSIRRLEKDGGTFRIVEPTEVPAILHELRAVSDDWLKEKAGAEKGFSLGFFDDAYLVRFPIAVIERAGRIQAFTNIWRGSQKHELSVDLMRYHHDAPKSVIEALFVHVMKWGKDQGYRWFALGMAPLSGFERSPVAPLWARIGTFLYEHGESVYNYQGLRAYKEKFNPLWEPRYLAYPGGLRLPRIMADLSALVAGGYRRIFLK